MQAEAAARAITDPDGQAQALAELARVAADVGDPERAGALAGRGRGGCPGDRRSRLAGGGAGRAGAGWRRKRGSRTGPGQLPGRSPSRYWQATGPGAIWPGPRRRGDRRAGTWRAGPRRLPGRSPTRAGRRRRWAIWRGPWRRRVTRTGPGRWPAKRRRLPRAITDPERQAQVLAGLARAAAEAGDPEREGADRAGRAAVRAITDPDRQGADCWPSWRGQRRIQGTQDQAGALAGSEAAPRNHRPGPAGAGAGRAGADGGGAGDPDRAEATAQAIADPDGRAEVLGDLARVAAEAGDPERARTLAGQAEAAARAVIDPDWQAQVLRSAGAGRRHRRVTRSGPGR